MPKKINLHPTSGLTGRNAFYFYRRNSTTFKYNKIDNHKEWLIILNALWKEVGTQLLDSPGGVFVPRLGYFAIWMSPTKSKQYYVDAKIGSVKTYNDHTGHHAFHPGLFTSIERGGGDFRYWTMDRAFSRSITRGLAKRLKAGKKYVLKYTLVKKLFKTPNIR